MNPDQARGSLDDIHRLQDRTRGAYVRHGFARPYILATALGVFIALASIDLPSPWSTVVFLGGEGLLLSVMAVHRRRAPVRRKPTFPEVVFYAVFIALLLALYVAYSIAATLGVLAFGLPMQHTVAAAALALTTLAIAAPARRVLHLVLRG